VCISLCTTVVHNTAQSSSDYLPSYPPDKHQSLDAVYWRGGELQLENKLNNVYGQSELKQNNLKQGVALTGRNHTGRRAVSAARPPTYSARRWPTVDAPSGWPTRRQRYRRRQQTMTTDVNKQNNTGPLGGPVITYILVCPSGTQWQPAGTCSGTLGQTTATEYHD